MLRLINRNFKRQLKSFSELSLAEEKAAISILREWKAEPSKFSIISIEQITAGRSRSDEVLDVGSYSDWVSKLNYISDGINKRRIYHVCPPDFAASEQHLIRFVYLVFATESMRFSATCNLIMIQMVLDLLISEKIDFPYAFGGFSNKFPMYPMAYEKVVIHCRGLVHLFNRFFSVKYTYPGESNENNLDFIKTIANLFDKWNESKKLPYQNLTEYNNFVKFINSLTVQAKADWYSLSFI